MATEKFFVFNEDGALKRLKGRIVRYLDNEDPTGSDKSAIRTSLEVSPDAAGLVQADVGTAPNEIPVNGMLGDMAYQSSDGVSMVNAEVETLEVTGQVSGNLTVSGDVVTSTRVAADTINGYTGASVPLTIQTGGAQSLILGTNATERVRIDSGGNVGIGSASPIGPLTVQVAADKNLVTSTQYSGASLEAVNDAYSANIPLAIYGSPIRLLSGNVEVNSGNIVMGSSYGIDFGSGASTTLDDYEEGYHTVTATPTTSGSVTLSTGANTFTYTKIGNIVSVSGTVIVSSVSSPVGGLWLSLPVGSVTLTSSAGLVGGSVYYQDSGTGNFVKPFRIQANALIEILIDASTLAANDRFGLNVTYRTTAS